MKYKKLIAFSFLTQLAVAQPPQLGMPTIPGAPPVATIVEDTRTTTVQTQPNTSQVVPTTTTTTETTTETTQADTAGASRYFALEKEESPTDGSWVKDAPLNELLQYLARKARIQYMHNPKLADVKVTGHIYEENPLEQMEQISFLNQVTIYRKGNTIYAMLQDDLDKLPLSKTTYRLKYLRPSDVAPIENIIKPMLSTRGNVTLEPKTSTLVLRDSEANLKQIIELLNTVDCARRQIIVETKVMRTRGGHNNRIGVDWAATLGSGGLSLNAVQSLSNTFGLPGGFDGSAFTFGGAGAAAGGGAGGGTGGAEDEEPAAPTSSGPDYNSNIALSPLQASVVLRALNDGQITDQISSPIIVTEDNEKASLYIIDRIPIFTSSNTQSVGQSSSTSDVRYKIDAGDPSGDPETSREIGISMVVTPTILPDNTIRMKLKPRIASIVGFKTDATSGNSYPEVNEAGTELTARVPNGYTLIIGGFYGTQQISKDNKVPFLGDIPGLGFFFKSKSRESERSSLVFMVTPKTYDAAAPIQGVTQSERLRRKIAGNQENDFPDNDDAFDNSISNPRNLNPFDRERKTSTNPLNPYNPKIKGESQLETAEEANTREILNRIESHRDYQLETTTERHTHGNLNRNKGSKNFK